MKIWMAVLIGTIALSILYGLFSSIRVEPIQPKSIPEPLAFEDATSSIFPGTVFKIDNSNHDLLSARMEMVQLKLDKGEPPRPDFMAARAPTGTFKEGDRAMIKSMYFKRSAHEVQVFDWIILKEQAEKQ